MPILKYGRYFLFSFKLRKIHPQNWKEFILILLLGLGSKEFWGLSTNLTIRTHQALRIQCHDLNVAYLNPSFDILRPFFHSSINFHALWAQRGTVYTITLLHFFFDYHGILQIIYTHLFDGNYNNLHNLFWKQSHILCKAHYDLKSLQVFWYNHLKRPYILDQTYFLIFRECRDWDC